MSPVTLVYLDSFEKNEGNHKISEIKLGIERLKIWKYNRSRIGKEECEEKRVNILRKFYKAN